MPRTSLERSCRRHRRIVGILVAAACWLPWFSYPAQAHVISIGRGSVVVYPDHLTVEWKVAAEDFVHYYGLGATSTSPLTAEAIQQIATRHADYLLEHFIIRDAEGRRLSGRLVSQTMDPDLNPILNRECLRSQRVAYVFEYAFGSSPRYLSFQQSLGVDIVAFPSQLHLDVRPVGVDSPKFIRLTNGGNVETLRLDWPGSGDGPPTIVGPIEELQSVLGYVDVGDDDVRVTVEVPLVLLETFLSVERADPDFLEVSEQRAALPRLLTFFHSRNPIWINGRPVESSEARLVFLDADSSDSETNGPSVRRGAWMTRVKVFKMYRLNARPEQIEIRWNFFNPAVLVAEAIVTCNNRRSTRRISTYEPTLRWNRVEADKTKN